MAAKQVTITDGDDPSIPMWIGSALPPVDVLLRGKIEDGHLRCYLDIDMTETLKQVIRVAIGDGYQLPNQSFEAWHTSSGTYQEPNGWHSFESATGNFASSAGHHLAKSDDAHSGAASARIFATAIKISLLGINIVANGTMTTGRLNAGNATAASTDNNAYLDMSKSDKDGNGDPFYIPLYSRPDALAMWVKFNQGTANSQHPYATVSAIITDGKYYQDPENKTYTNVVAKAQNKQIATTGDEWVLVTIPFEYTENNVEPKAILITVSTNADAGQGSGGDEVLVDDIALIYNARVTSLKIKGQDVPGFSSDNTSYEMELNQEITADDIEVETDGKAAHVIKSVKVADGGYVCTVDAVSGDMSVMTSYVVNVKSNATHIRNIPSAAPRSATSYTLDGRQTETLVPGRVYISRQADGTVTKVRR